MLKKKNSSKSDNCSAVKQSEENDEVKEYRAKKATSKLLGLGVQTSEFFGIFRSKEKVKRNGNIRKDQKDMSREDFEAKVWNWKAESGGTITQQLRRLGASCDWSREKFTLGAPNNPDDKMVEAVTKVFVELYDTVFDGTTQAFRKKKPHEKGLIYRDKRLVNWDPKFQTAISDLEVETKTVDGHYWHLRYPLADGETYEHPITDEGGNVTGAETRDYIVVATSRPETMLGDTGVAVHPDDARYAMLVGKAVILPIVNRRIPIIADDYADPDKGSGAVKITPAHDFNDYEVGRRAGHEPISILDESAHILPLTFIPDDYHGKPVKQARKMVVAAFDAAGLLQETEDLKIEQPVGDRSGVVIEPMLTDQWFVDAKALAKDAIAAVDRGHEAGGSKGPRDMPEGDDGGDGVPNTPLSSINTASTSANTLSSSAPVPIITDTDNQSAASNTPSSSATVPRTSHTDNDKGSTRFIPENWKKTYDNWMHDIQPWCISRQLWWGHRIPALIGPKDLRSLPSGKGRKNEFVAYDMDDALKEAEDYYKDDDAELVIGIGDEISAFTKFEGDKKVIYITLVRDPDVLDTWFSSGLWPFSTLGWPDNTEELARFYPGSVLVTAFDIIFFWVARMMMQGIHFMGEVPFKDVYIHALVLDEKGQKMSKSKGNVIDPLELIDTYGADALRFTMAAMAAQGRNVRLSTQRIEGYRNFGTKLWNAARFAQINGCEPQEGFDPSSCTQSVNQWIVAEAVKTAKEVSRFIDDYRFDAAADAAYKFARGSYCDWYLELIKPVMAEQGDAKIETQATAAWALDQILKLLHPFMPFITEELWAKTAQNRADKLIITPWPDFNDEKVAAAHNNVAAEDINWLIRLITAIRSVRAEMNVPPSNKAPLLMIGEKLDPRLALYAENLERMARVKGVELSGEPPKGALQAVVDGVGFAIPLDGLIDLSAEKARLSKEIAKIISEMDKIDKKLSNDAFIAKAPENVVALQKERRDKYQAELTTLNDALSKFD